MFRSLKQYISIRNAIYFFSFIAGWPCVFYLMGWLPHYTVNYAALLSLCIIFVVLNATGGIPTEIKRLIAIQATGWVLYSIIHVDSSYINRDLILLIVFLVLCLQYNDPHRLGFVKIYDGWIVVQVILGTIGLILVLNGLLQPLFTFKEMDLRTGYCFGLFTTNTYLGGLVRNAGFFDEPGALACWGMYALLFNKLFVKNKIIEYVLIFGLISTLSMAYFIQLALYLLTFYRERSWKLILVFASVYIAMSIVASYNDAMDSAIFGRFQYNEKTGTFEGDNRSELLARCWKIFCDYPIFGAGARNLISHEFAVIYGGFVGANFFFNWAADGLIGFIITYIPLIYLFRLGKVDKTYYGVALILLFGFLQRPYDSTQVLFPLLIYTIILQSYCVIYESNDLSSYQSNDS